MNIVWQVSQKFERKNHLEKDKTLEVNPQDIWKNISLSKPIVRTLKGSETVDITHKGEIFRDIPTHWYMIEN